MLLGAYRTFQPPRSSTTRRNIHWIWIAPLGGFYLVLAILSVGVLVVGYRDDRAVQRLLAEVAADPKAALPGIERKVASGGPFGNVRMAAYFRKHELDVVDDDAALADLRESAKRLAGVDCAWTDDFGEVLNSPYLANLQKLLERGVLGHAPRRYRSMEPDAAIVIFQGSLERALSEGFSVWMAGDLSHREIVERLAPVRFLVEVHEVPVKIGHYEGTGYPARITRWKVGIR